MSATTKAKALIEPIDEDCMEFCLMDFNQHKDDCYGNYENCALVEIDPSLLETYLQLQAAYAKMQDHLYKLFKGN